MTQRTEHKPKSNEAVEEFLTKVDSLLDMIEETIELDKRLLDRLPTAVTDNEEGTQ